jgi:hypothetical protein
MKRTALALVATLAAATAGTGATVPWDEAEQHVGESVTVEGRVLGVECSALACRLAFDPALKRFTAVIEAPSFEHFPPEELERRYGGRRVLVEGTIQDVKGKPLIVIDGPQALKLADDPAEREAAAEQAQVELMERLGEVLTRVTEMTERLAATQERVEALLAQLEQRAAALAVGPTAPPAPPAASDGEPQPRPAYEALRTVKRGMSTAEVERLIGQPQYVARTGMGWTTWYYSFGRSISFDARGKVRSLVGFPAP